MEKTKKKIICILLLGCLIISACGKDKKEPVEKVVVIHPDIIDGDTITLSKDDVSIELKTVSNSVIGAESTDSEVVIYLNDTEFSTCTLKLIMSKDFMLPLKKIGTKDKWIIYDGEMNYIATQKINSNYYLVASTKDVYKENIVDILPQISK